MKIHSSTIKQKLDIAESPYYRSLLWPWSSSAAASV